jgi:hypothetical protein
MTPALNRVFSDDLKFLKDNGRNFRVRVASRAELEDEGRVGTLDDFQRVYVVVRQVRPGVLRRIFLVGADGLPTDLSEDQARALFEDLASQAGNRDAAITVH